MSGFYQNWYKVQHPDSRNDITPMESGGFQTPFYFGGSQVPVNLGIDLHEQVGRGIGDYSKMNFMPIKKGKRGQQTNYHMQSNIHLPRMMGSLSKHI